MVAPQSAMNTLTAVKGTAFGSTSPAQKLGQKSHKTILPSMENWSLVWSASTGTANSSLVVMVIMTPSPKMAPKACIKMEPPVSTKPP